VAQFNHYPEWGRIASRTELQKYYEAMREEIIGYKAAARTSGIVAE